MKASIAVAQLRHREKIKGENLARNANPVTVKNLSTGEIQRYTCTPREAVIAAHAQSLNDWNTWQYAERYGHLVIRGSVTVCCGDFCAYEKGPFLFWDGGPRYK